MFWNKKKKINTNTNTNTNTDNNNDFCIEYYPFSKLYYPKYKGRYLKKVHPSGIIITQDDILFANEFHEEMGAIRFIKKFKEQMFKEGVVIIPYKD